MSHEGTRRATPAVGPRRTKRASGIQRKRAAAQRATSRAQSPGGGAAGFGFPPDDDMAAAIPSDFELPKDLRDLL